MKKRMNSKRIAIAAIMSTAVVAVTTGAAYAQDQASRVDAGVFETTTRCTNATLEGKYAAIGDGSVRFGGPTAPMVPFSTVSLLTMDGAGGLTNKVTRSIDGNISRGLDPGSYNVNSDCTGSMTIGTLTFDLVIANLKGKRDGSLFYFIATTPGGVVTATAKRVN